MQLFQRQVSNREDKRLFFNLPESNPSERLGNSNPGAHFAPAPLRHRLGVEGRRGVNGEKVKTAEVIFKGRSVREDEGLKRIEVSS